MHASLTCSTGLHDILEIDKLTDGFHAAHAETHDFHAARLRDILETNKLTDGLHVGTHGFHAAWLHDILETDKLTGGFHAAHARTHGFLL